MQTVTTIGLDIAKSVFQVHCVDAAGQVVIRRKLKRRTVPAFFQKLPPCLVGSGGPPGYGAVIGQEGSFTQPTQAPRCRPSGSAMGRQYRARGSSWLGLFPRGTAERRSRVTPVISAPAPSGSGLFICPFPGSLLPGCGKAPRPPRWPPVRSALRPSRCAVAR